MLCFDLCVVLVVVDDYYVCVECCDCVDFVGWYEWWYVDGCVDVECVCCMCDCVVVVVGGCGDYVCYVLCGKFCECVGCVV